MHRPRTLVPVHLGLNLEGFRFKVSGKMPYENTLPQLPLLQSQCPCSVLHSIWVKRSGSNVFFMRRKFFWKNNFLLLKMFCYWSLMDSGYIFMANGVILKHIEVDKITWGGHFLKKSLHLISMRNRHMYKVYWMKSRVWIGHLKQNVNKIPKPVKTASKMLIFHAIGSRERCQIQLASTQYQPSARKTSINSLMWTMSC
jgi:hypothetical protein